MQIFLLKTDSDGNEIWTEYFGGEYEDYARTIEPTADGGFIITGFTQPSSNKRDLFLLKTDPQGGMEWIRSYDISSSDHGFCGRQTNDGGYILIGMSTNYVTGSEDILLLKTDASGNMLWYQLYGGSGYCYGHCVQQTSDGGYIVFGSTELSGNGSRDFYLIKTDSQGNEIWSRVYGGPYDDYGFWIEQTPDGGFICTGLWGTSIYWEQELYLEKMDADGNTIWDILWCEDDVATGNSVQNTSDGGFIVTGMTRLNTEPDKLLILKTDQDGNILWTQTVTHPYRVEGYCIRETMNQDYIISGWAIIPPSDCRVYLARLQAQTSTIEVLEDGSQPENIILSHAFPNPFNPATVISYQLSVVGHVNLAVYDVSGRQVAELVDGWRDAGLHEVMFDGSGLASGVYIYRLEAGDCVRTGKMALIK
jgi:hypothetical protein